MNLAREIYKTSFLSSKDKRYILSNGEVSSHYWDKYGFMAQPELLKPITEGLAEFLKADLPEVVVGLELGGVVLATSLSLYLGIPLAICRKKAKDYGTQRLLEGEWVSHRRCVLVEDVVTTGRALEAARGAVEAQQGIVAYSVCVINRGDIFELRDLPVMSLFTEQHLLP